MTDCQCEGPGYCERHDVKKSPHWFHLCRTRDDYFQAWEQGRGPGQKQTKKPRKPRKPAGPGGELRRMLGCSAKHWPNYAKMDKLGINCEHHVAELAASLVEHKCVRAASSAERIIKKAIERSRL